MFAPLGTELETFIQLLEEDTSPNEEGKQYLDAMIIAIPIFEALGVPRELLIWEEKAIKEMIMLGQKFKEAQRLRKTKG